MVSGVHSPCLNQQNLTERKSLCKPHAYTLLLSHHPSNAVPSFARAVHGTSPYNDADDTASGALFSFLFLLSMHNSLGPNFVTSVALYLVQ
jgi:hypothetical protein